VFAEGGTSNGTGLIKFKKGAFYAEKRVKPIFIRYSFGTINLSFDIIPFLPLVILHLSYPGCFSCVITEMPDF